MNKSHLSQGVRQYIRKEKARIRREVQGVGEQEKQILEFIQKFHKKEVKAEKPEAPKKVEKKK